MINVKSSFLADLSAGIEEKLLTIISNMLPRWGKAVTYFSKTYLQNNTRFRTDRYFAYRNYSKVSAATTTSMPDLLVKEHSDKPESIGLERNSKKFEGREKSRPFVMVSIKTSFSVFNLEKTFKATFSLLVVHMWLCLRRLKEEGNEGVNFGQHVYEIYNHDVELRASKAGVNLLLSRHMKNLERIFYGNIVAYDSAMLPEARQDELHNVIWRNVLSDDGSPMSSDASRVVQACFYLVFQLLLQ
ncbi:hypothetical protein GIB67_039715 [Kingdonia uniflora]|uniref:Ubiquinol-cytochrome c chaperone domain-containing protein n=1 Tax=Kingdonia uniflora TaxID=39325 RepID=A0A7J7MQ39_9MAGN|nr:hypothetical protein GIB67_039715 [Kingdonia uniflora]